MESFVKSLSEDMKQQDLDSDENQFVLALAGIVTSKLMLSLRRGGWEVFSFCLRRNQNGETKSCFAEADLNFASECYVPKMSVFVSVIWERRLLKPKCDKEYGQLNDVEGTSLIILVTP